MEALWASWKKIIPWGNDRPTQGPDMVIRYYRLRPARENTTTLKVQHWLGSE